MQPNEHHHTTAVRGAVAALALTTPETEVWEKTWGKAKGFGDQEVHCDTGVVEDGPYTSRFVFSILVDGA